MIEKRKAKVTAETLMEADKLRALWKSTPNVPSQAEFGDVYKIGNQSAVGQFLLGNTPLSLKAATGFATGLGCKIEDFSPRLARVALSAGAATGISIDSNVAPASIGGIRIPVINYVQAGMWSGVIDGSQHGDADDWLTTDQQFSRSAFALEIKGDSMLPKFEPGDRVIIDPDVAPLPGDFVVAKNGEEEATFKKYRPRGADASGETVFELVPLNDDYAPMRSDLVPIRIVGTMVEHRKYRRAR